MKKKFIKYRIASTGKKQKGISLLEILITLIILNITIMIVIKFQILIISYQTTILKTATAFYAAKAISNLQELFNTEQQTNKYINFIKKILPNSVIVTTPQHLKVSWHDNQGISHGFLLPL